MPTTLTTPHARQGATGRWTFVLVSGDNHVLATSEWGTNYEFAIAQWEALPVVEE